MVVEGSAEYVLVIGVERLSDLTYPEDRATAFLFGDGAGAVVVGPSQEPAIGPSDVRVYTRRQLPSTWR